MSELKNDSVELDMVSVTTGASALGITLPEGGSEKEIVEALRAGFSKRLEGVPKDDWIECSKCLEFTDDAEELYACPFCGDDGSEDDSEEPEATSEGVEEPEAVDAEDLDSEDADEPKEPPTADLNEATTEPEAKKAPAKKAPAKKAPAKAELVNSDEAPEDALEVDEDGNVPMGALLNREKHVIKIAQTNMVKNAYKLGMALKRVNDGDLWKADGLKSFRKFIETTPLSNSYVYGLIKMVNDFTEKEFLEIGRKKLIIVAKADPKDRKALLEAAKTTKGKKALAAEAAKLADARATTDGTTATPPAKELKAATPPTKEDSITLLTKVGGKPLMLRFLDRKTKTALEQWKQDSYVEVVLSEKVSQLISIKTNEAGEFVGLVVAFTERPKAAE